MTPLATNPVRGEIWQVRFDPTKGDEIGKTRPALVLNPPSIGRLRLRIVVPVTDWKGKYATVPWLVHLVPTATNGLTKESAADCFQVKSISVDRFVRRLGSVSADDIQEVSACVALCVDA